jgi:hypothetical protein
MFGKFLVHARRHVEVCVKNILYQFIKGPTRFGCQEVLKRGRPSMYQNKLLFIQIQTLHPSMSQKWKDFIEFNANNQCPGPTIGTNS